jgi:hypothetical protein
VLLAGLSADSIVDDTTGEEWEADRSPWRRGPCRSPTSWTAAAWCSARPAGRLVGLADAGAWSRGATAPGSSAALPAASAPGRLLRVVVGDRAKALTRLSRRRRAAADVAADVPDLPGGRPASSPREVLAAASTGGRWRSSCRRSRGGPVPRVAVDPGTAASPRGSTPVETGRAGPGVVRVAGRLRAGAERLADDAGRDQHLRCAACRLLGGRGPRSSHASHLEAVRRRWRRRGRAAHPPPPRPLGERAFAEAAACGCGRSTRRTGSGPGPRGRDVVAVDGLEVHVVATPGTRPTRCPSCCRRNARRHGDTVLGRGTTVAVTPTAVGAYLASLDRLHAWPRRTRSGDWPGRPGDPRRSPALDHYLAHAAAGRPGPRGLRSLHAAAGGSSSTTSVAPASSRSCTPTSTSPLARRRASVRAQLAYLQRPILGEGVFA